MSNTNDDRLDELLIKALDQRVSDAESAELEQLLLERPEARQAYLDLVILESYLEMEHRTQEELRTLPKAERARGVSLAIQRTAGFFAKPTPISMTVATLVIGLLLTAMGFMVAPIYRALAPPAPPESSPQIVALLSALNEPVWSAGESPADRGARLLNGQTLRLESGLAELSFFSGATVILEGPAEFRLDTRMAGELLTGRAVVKVPPQARGFSVTTPTAVIVDYGTEFGVAASTNATNVAVYAGVVTVGLRESAETVPPQRLVAGETADVAAGKIVRRTAAETSPTFVREMPLELIAAVRSSTGNPYLVVHNGLREDARAYSDELHEWNGIDATGIPAELVGATYVRTANLDRDHKQFQVFVQISHPAVLYVFWNEKQKPSPWLEKDFQKTEMRIGMDAVAGRGWPEEPGVGLGESVDLKFDIWQREITEASVISLGLTQSRRSAIFGIAAVPLNHSINSE